MERLIFHIDVNSAFLSWEAVRRVKAGEPDLRLIPSAIGGDRAKRTGVILAKSIPAKKLGIKTGEPVAMALRKCPDLYLARPDFRLYEKNSRAFVKICEKYAPVVERFSIDECFLDMTGTGQLYPDPIQIAYTIKDEIRDMLGFTVNIGIGSNKLLAKMASDFEKPDKVHTLFLKEVPQKLWPLPVRDLFSVGGATAEKLEKLNVRTIGDLAKISSEALQTVLGNKMGEHLYRYANGIDDTPVCGEARAAKGYSISTTVEEDVTDLEQANHILLALADSVSSRMRADDMKTTCVAVTIRSHDFRDRSHQIKLDHATDITGEIFTYAKRAFSVLWDQRTPLRLIGVSLTGITHGEAEQISMFEDEKKEKARKVDRVVDFIRSQYGMGTIVRGTVYHSSLKVGKKYTAHMETDSLEMSQTRKGEKE